MKFEKLNVFNTFCDNLQETIKQKPSQIIIIWKSYKWKIFWIGYNIGKILTKLGIKKVENKLHR